MFVFEEEENICFKSSLITSFFYQLPQSGRGKTTKIVKNNWGKKKGKEKRHTYKIQRLHKCCFEINNFVKRPIKKAEQ